MKVCRSHLFGVNVNVQINALEGAIVDLPGGGNMALVAQLAELIRPLHNTETDERRRSVLTDLVREMNKLSAVWTQEAANIHVRDRAKLYYGLVYLVWDLTPRASTVHRIIEPLRTALNISDRLDDATAEGRMNLALNSFNNSVQGLGE